MAHRIRVFVFDRHPLIVTGLRLLFEAEADFLVCGTCDSIREINTEVLEHKPDVIVSELAVPELEQMPIRLPVDYPAALLFTSILPSDTATNLGLMLGGVGVVSKTQPAVEILAAVRTAYGRRYSSRKSKAVAYAATITGFQDQEVGTPLTKLERELISCVARGLPDRAAAQSMGVSLRQVSGLRAHLMRRLYTKSPAQFVRMCFETMKLPESTAIRPANLGKEMPR